MRIKLTPKTESQLEANKVFTTFIRLYGYKTLTDFCKKNNVNYPTIRHQLRGRHYIELNFINSAIQLVNPNYEMKILNNGQNIIIGTKTIVNEPKAS
jgi:hypothetical protein